MSAASRSRYGFPSGCRTSWNQTVGGVLTYGRSHESQGKLVCDLPVTKPQLIAATRCCLASGKIVSKVLPADRAMYSVQMIGRWYCSRPVTSFSKFSGQL